MPYLLRTYGECGYFLLRSTVRSFQFALNVKRLSLIDYQYLPLHHSQSARKDCSIFRSSANVMSVNGAKKRWQAIVRKLRSQPIDEGPPPKIRHNTPRHPNDVEEGYFCDSLVTLLHARGALCSESDLHRESRPANEVHTQSHNAMHQEWMVSMEEAEFGEVQVWEWDYPQEPIGVVAYRLVRDYFAKRLKRASKRSSQRSSTSQSINQPAHSQEPTGTQN